MAGKFRAESPELMRLSRFYTSEQKWVWTLRSDKIKELSYRKLRAQDATLLRIKLRFVYFAVEGAPKCLQFRLWLTPTKNVYTHVKNFSSVVNGQVFCVYAAYYGQCVAYFSRVGSVFRSGQESGQILHRFSHLWHKNSTYYFRRKNALVIILKIFQISSSCCLTS